jgi:integrase
MQGCDEYKSVIEDMKFEGLRPRKAVVTASQIIAARQAAHEIGHPRLALCFAIQFETVLRQFDVAGVWRPLNYPAVSPVLGDREKWIGPTWSDIDDNMILTATPSKTEKLENAPEDVQFDLKVCPMVMEEIQRIPIDERVGPLITDPRSNGPYNQRQIRDLWRRIVVRAGIPQGIQNRDLRAGGITETERAGGRLEDASKQAAHRKLQTTAVIYQRGTLEAHRRNAAVRKEYRQKQDGK